MSISRSIVVALTCIAAAVLGRISLEQVVPGVLPFLFTFPAVIVAVLFGAELAGWITLGACQLLSLAFVLPHWIRDSGDRPQDAVNLLLATASLALVVWATGAYRAAERGLRRQCEREVRTLSLLANEVDHRTKNNFQLAAALLHAQGLSADRPVREELEVAASRLVSIAAIYRNLSARDPDAGDVRLLDHAREIADGLRAGLLPPEVKLLIAGDDVSVPATTALLIGLVINEWVTNAVKYAFPAGDGTIEVEVARHPDALVVVVSDDGVGLPAGHAEGQGSKLLRSLVEAIDGRLERRSEAGTVATLTVPLGSGTVEESPGSV